MIENDLIFTNDNCIGCNKCIACGACINVCEHKGVEIIEANVCKDHIHMLVSIAPKLSVAQFMGYLQEKSSLMIFDYAN